MTASNARPVWRSMLYVPANNAKFISKAHTRGADAIILDLEDSVPVTERPAARAALPENVRTAGQAGADVTIRINHDEMKADLDAAIIEGVRALLVAKSETPEQISALEQEIARLERERDLPEGGIGLSLMIESPGALRRAVDIAAASKRAIAMSLGGEDFATEMQFPPSPETLELPKLMCLMAAREAGLMPLGTLGTVADYGDLDAVRVMLSRTRAFGFEGAACIHPAIVPLLNEAFSPTADEVDWAERVVSEYRAAQEQGKGAITVDGKMVDVPVAIRAERLLERHRAVSNRAATTRRPLT